jgi:creatinine amidohydrolase
MACMGGAVETSVMLHLRPDLVRQDALAHFPSTGRTLAAPGGVLGLEEAAGLGWMMQDVNSDGACGNATAATAAKGERLLGHRACSQDAASGMERQAGSAGRRSARVAVSFP